MKQKQSLVIVGIHISNRFKQVAKLQKIFTKFGCQIKTRLGLHRASEDFCAMDGLILLEMFGDAIKIREFFDAVNSLQNLEVKKMTFKI
ncbi:MAG: hypothetical protein A2X77_02725 [Gammaproteobacteria bacterium GWE2_42_36]|nr:MAG: hypothetical protein A2X77_02725 [Gammaproteobacteria bacterium GWE2_42_36]HCU05924.1 hypothetical protein [Coxiellaceae bacterium]